jgi:hypothetical protein
VELQKVWKFRDDTTHIGGRTLKETGVQHASAGVYSWPRPEFFEYRVDGDLRLVLVRTAFEIKAPAASAQWPKATKGKESRD